jgi:ABC-type glycerol-3-phosphate transport system permease component
MPIVSVVERATLKGRLMMGLCYVLLAAGGLTAIYPFLLMLRLSTSDTTDSGTLDVAPIYWWNQDSLAKKYAINRYYGVDQNPYVPEVQPDFGPMPTRGPEWTASTYAQLPNFWKTYYAMYGIEPVSGQIQQVSDYRDFLSKLPPNDYITVDWDPDPDFLIFKRFLAEKLHLSKATRNNRYLVRTDASIRDWHPHFDESYSDSVKYLEWTKPQFRRPLYPPWVTFLKAKYGQFDVSKLNQAYRAHFASWTELRFPLQEPTQRAQKSDYREFVANDFPHLWLRISGDHQRDWQNFLIHEQRIRTPADWLRLTGLRVPSVASIRFPAELPPNEGWALMWSRFVHSKIGIEDRVIRSPDRLYVELLKDRYGSLDKLNVAWSTTYASWSEITYAEGLSDYRTLITQATPIKMALTFHPYSVALSYLVTESTAILNTVFLMILALGAALTVNPLAAYALSRFQIRGSHKILLFILATMALPAEVAMVPSFLLVKNLGLMNNYLALILPGAASAFGIFLLKGFFDSLPSELYEAATLDGAKELTMFARITIPLSTPILAVTAMGAVLGAYGTFVPAILYLPNSDMWPIMPKLFSMSTLNDGNLTEGVNMAALVIASIPTFLVFLFAQRLIMRGIVLPTFK